MVISKDQKNIRSVRDPNNFSYVTKDGVSVMAAATLIPRMTEWFSWRMCALNNTKYPSSEAGNDDSHHVRENSAVRLIMVIRNWLTSLGAHSELEKE